MSQQEWDRLQNMNEELFIASPLIQPLMLKITEQGVDIYMFDTMHREQIIASAQETQNAKDVIRAYYAGAAQHARTHRC